MKSIKFIFCCCLLFAFSLQTMGQYVTLQGRQFKKADGSNFYPLVCNYVVDLAFDHTNYFLMPHFNYGSNPWPGAGGEQIECNGAGGGNGSCLQHLRFDFREIKRMGFNSVRIMGAEVKKDDFSYPAANCSTGSSGVNVYKDHFVSTFKYFPFSGCDANAFGFLEYNTFP